MDHLISFGRNSLELIHQAVPVKLSRFALVVVDPTAICDESKTSARTALRFGAIKKKKPHP